MLQKITLRRDGVCLVDGVLATNMLPYVYNDVGGGFIEVRSIGGKKVREDLH